MWHAFETETKLPLRRQAVFDFFADAGNLERITPPELRFRIITPLPVEMRKGARIEYRLSLYRIPFKWRTEIIHWEPPHSFVDSQISGPYRSWVHRHRFLETGNGTLMTDRVEYRLPFNPLGEVVFPLVKREVRRIFSYREQTIQRILAPTTDSGAAGRQGGLADTGPDAEYPGACPDADP